MTNPGGPPTPPAQPPMLTGAMLNMRIAHGDPQFPKELWGKTLAEGMRFYSIMREDFMRNNNPAGRGGDPGQQPPAAAPVARPAYVPPAAAPAPAAGSFDPASISEMINAAVSQAFARSPMAVQAADSTHDRMKREYPDWMHYDADILATLEGASAEQLTNPETWRTAYYFVKGRVLSTPGNNGQPQQPSTPQYQPPTVFGAHPGQPTVTRPPDPPTSANPTWFTEGPTAPASTPGAAVDPRNDPRVIAMAARHGIPVDEYVQWLGGQVPAMHAPART